MSKYNVGDLVKIIAENSGEHTDLIGDTTEVIYKATDGTYHLDNVPFTFGLWNDNELEKTKFQRGEKVKVTGIHSTWSKSEYLNDGETYTITGVDKRGEYTLSGIDPGDETFHDDELTKAEGLMGWSDEATAIFSSVWNNYPRNNYPLSLNKLQNVLNKENKMSNIVNKIKDLKLSTEDRNLRKAGLVDDRGDLTGDGKEVLLALVFKDYKAIIAGQALKVLDDEKKKK